MSVAFHKPPTRHYRLGGFCIKNDTAVQWASRLKGRELHPVMDRPTIKKTVFDKSVASRINFRQVGEVSGVDWMLVTQSAPFKGYKDMNASEIPQFEPGEKDAIAQKFLEEAGTSIIMIIVQYSNDHQTLGIKEYEFATFLNYISGI